MGPVPFTAKELEDALYALMKLEEKYPDYPLVHNFEDDYELWNESSFPLTLRNVAGNENVDVSCEAFFPGEEGGDHGMYIILKTGWGANARYFRKTGLYNSWDDSEWDGEMEEVVSKEVKRTEWVSK